MKSFLIALLLLCTISSFSQGIIDYSLTVYSNDKKPIPNLAVNATETSTLKQINGKTNAQGNIRFKLAGGKEWAISVGELRRCVFATLTGAVMTVNKNFIYDPKDYNRRHRQDPNRSNAKFKVITQSVKEDAPLTPGQSLLRVKLGQPDGKDLQGYKVEAVNVKDSIVYATTSDAEGMAFMVLPNNNSYDIDINGTRNFNYMDFGPERTIESLYLIYAPTKTKEKIVNDTTYQELADDAKPSSERALMKISVSGGSKDGVKERVFLRQLGTGRVFSAVTNENHYAVFLIPVKQVYMVDFNYQKDVDAVNLKYAEGLYNGQVRVNYFPDPRLEFPETFIPTPDRMILQNFNQFLEKQFTKPKDKPFNFLVKSINRIHKNSREALFMLTLAGADSYGSARLPMNAALVLDKSGSMYSDGRSEALKKTLLNLGAEFTDKDIVSVILFDNEASEVQHSTSQHKQGFEVVVENYTPSGGTNILGGLQKGAESLGKTYDVNKSNKIILLTDGYGDNQPKDITDFVEAKFNEGLEFSAIGLGSDFNQSLLELIAAKGNGYFSYVDSSAALSEIFAEEMKNTFRYSARELKIDILHNDKLIFSNLYGYPVKGKTNNSVSFEIGKVPFGKNDIAFLKFKLNKPSREIESSPLKVVVSYFDMVKNQQVKYEQELRLTWTEETKTELLLDQEEKKLYAIAILNQSLKVMAESHMNNDAAKAKDALVSGKEQIEEIFPAAKPKDVQSLFDDLNKYLQLFIQMEKNKG